MFRLIKLGIYLFLGYALYELYQGMMSEQSSAQSGGGARGGSRRNITGHGEGIRQRSEDNTGASSTHQVGRGVVS